MFSQFLNFYVFNDPACYSQKSLSNTLALDEPK